MKDNKIILLDKAITIMKSAVGIYNNPTIDFKSEIFIVNAIIAWSYLLQAYYEKKGIDYYYFKINKNGEKEYEKLDGRKKVWDITKIISNSESPLNEEQKSNLLLLIKVRNAIEHSALNNVDYELSSYIFACCINFNQVLKDAFGKNYALDKYLGIAIQFASLNPLQINTLKSKDSEFITNIISEFQTNLSDFQKQSLEFSYKVQFVPFVSNKENKSNNTIGFSKDNQRENINMDVYIKEVEKPKFLPKEVVKKMQDKGFCNFNTYKHTVLWKKIDAKRAGAGYGVLVSGKWYWYQNWVDFVEEELKRNANN